MNNGMGEKTFEDIDYVILFKIINNFNLYY